MAADNMATPDLLGHLAEVSQLQLHRVNTGSSTSSTNRSGQGPSHETSPVGSTDSYTSPNSVKGDAPSSHALSSSNKPKEGPVSSRLLLRHSLGPKPANVCLLAGIGDNKAKTTSLVR